MFRCLRPFVLGVALTLLLAGVATAATANRPPKFLPSNVVVTWNNKYSVISGAPAITAQTAKIKLGKGAKDPDGDRVTYRWAATNGKIKGNGLQATWVRVMLGPDSPKPGVVTVTALDGKGGKATRKLVFE